MKMEKESGGGTATDFNFVHSNHNHNPNYHHVQNNLQQDMYAYNYQAQFGNDPISVQQYQQIMSIPEDAAPPSHPFNMTTSQPTAFPQPQAQFYQQHSYSQPELQHISQYNNDLSHDFKQEEEITIESILEDDPLLSFTTTLDRQESNDTILQSSSPIKEPMEPLQQNVEPLDLNQNHIQQQHQQEQELSVNTAIMAAKNGSPSFFNQTTTPLNSFPTPANSTPSTGLPAAQSPNNSQSQFQTFSIQMPSAQPQQPLQPPQAQFMTFSNNSNSSLSQSSDEVVPVSHNNQSKSSTSSASSQSSIPNQNVQPQIPTTPTFRVQLQNSNVSHPQQQTQFQIQQPVSFVSNTYTPAPAPAPSFQSQKQQFYVSRPSMPQHSQSETQLPSRFKEVIPVPGKQKRKQSAKGSALVTPPTTTSKDMKLPPTPPAQKILPPSLNKSSSTTKLNKVKKSSVSGPSTSTLKLKKSKSFLNTTPVKESGPMFATLDFSKKIHSTSTNLINAKESKLLKNHSFSGLNSGLKGNVVKNYEFVMEPGREKIKGASASSSVKSTPRRPSNVGTPTSATSMKFPKLPKPPLIDPSSFSIYSPSNTNSSPTGSDASGHSPLTSAPAQYPFINQSPIPSNISRFDSNDSAGFTADQFLFGSSNRKTKRASISQNSPEKDQSPTVRSGANEFQFRINK